MPIVEVHMLEGRTDEMKEELMVKITNVVHETLNAPLESIRVIIEEMPLNHFCIAGETAKKRREKTGR